MPTDVRQRVLFGLAKRDPSNVAETMAAITEAAAEVLAVARVSVWRLVDGRELACQDLFVRAERRHTLAERLCASDYPGYFAALREQRTIAACDAAHDARTRELADGYLRPLGITAMLDVPIWQRGQVYGVLCNEDVGALRRWTADDIAFVTNLADIVALSLEAAERRVAEQRWRTIIQAIPEGVMVLRPNGTVERMNATMSALLEGAGGGPAEERMQLLDCVDVQGHPLPPDRNPFRRVLLCGERVNGEIVGVRMQDPSHHRYLRLTVTPLIEDGATAALVVVVSDISDELRFEHVKRDFLDALAHELKTPVAIAKGYAQLLSRTATLPDEQLSMVSAITRATDRMHRLIQGVVDVANLLLGKLSFDREPVALSDVARRVVDEVAETALLHDITLEITADGAVRGDLARIEQAVRQIVENAVRSTPEGGVVEVRVDRADRRVTLTVRDQGGGIAPEHVERVFDLFHWARSEPGQAAGGLGVGLFLAREIARRHGGDVTVASRAGEGTTVLLSLPREEETP